MRILILDNHREAPSFGASNLVRWALRMAPEGSEVLVRRPPDLDLGTLPRLDAVVISGSVTSCLPPHEGWVKAFDEWVIRGIERRIPILGICFGHQTLARCLFKMHAKEPLLGRSEKPEIGWQTQRILAPSRLFEGLPSAFVSYQSHYEEVTELPPGAKLLAESDRCRIQAIEVVGAPIFGVQFHPEHTIEGGEAAMKRKLEKGEPRDWILNPGKGPELYNDEVGKVIFGNFFRIAK